MKSFFFGCKKIFFLSTFLFLHIASHDIILFQYEKKNVKKINISKFFYKNTSHLAIHIFQTLQLFPNRSRVIRA